MNRYSFLFAACAVLALSVGVTAQEAAGKGHAAMFAQMDANGDAKISRAEWMRHRQAFARLDRDGGRFITREEMSATAGHTPQRQRARRGKFAKMDLDGDGRISRAEWRGKPKVFDRIDADHDGFITRDEWRNRRADRRLK